MPARRRRWIAWDVYFFEGSFGRELRNRFGTAGVSLFIGFLCACKRSPEQGQITFSSDAEVLTLAGLRDLRLVNDDGQAFDLTTFWRFLGDHHMTARRCRGDLTTIVSRRWDDWQKNIARPSDDQGNSTSEATGTNHERKRSNNERKRSARRPKTEDRRSALSTSSEGDPPSLEATGRPLPPTENAKRMGNLSRQTRAAGASDSEQ